MILENIDFLNEFNGVSVFVRLILALILGALLGIERERKKDRQDFVRIRLSVWVRLLQQ